MSEKAATTASLSDYLSLRGPKIGYAESLTFTSIHRCAAVSLPHEIGHNAARVTMNHGRAVNAPMVNLMVSGPDFLYTATPLDLKNYK